MEFTGIQYAGSGRAAQYSPMPNRSGSARVLARSGGGESIRVTVPPESGRIITYPTKQYMHSSDAKYAAEFVGTFFLVFTVGCNVHTGSIGAALSIGAILAVMVYSLGSVSGAHLNPAVTFSIGLSGRHKIDFQDFCCYIAAQILGGIFGGVCYFSIFGDAFLLHPNPAYSVYDALAVEMIYTMALCYVVLNVATTEHKEQGNVPNHFFGLAIGLTVTASAITIGSISGCSLNPAVSVGALFAAKLTAVTVPVRLWALYCLCPLGGAAMATAAFYIVQGGLTDQFEYEVIGGATRPPPTTVIMSPAYDRPKHSNLHLAKNETFFFDEETERHNISFGLMWEVADGFETSDIDASCVKFSADGKYMDSIYFSNRFGKEDKRSGESIVVHMGDNATGHGTGFGMKDVNSPAERRRRKKDGIDTHDDEQVEIRKLSRLQVVQPRAKYLFFVVNVFSAQHTFDHLKQMRVRVVDKDKDNQEICRYEKKSMKNNKNGFILGVLYSKHNIWRFRILDMEMDIKEHGTYRDF